MEMKIELLVLPVSDVDRARDFYAALGWNVDHDSTVTPELRFVQITPPGSACSIAFGLGLTDAAPGSVKGIQLVVGDADEALAQVQGAGIEARGVEDLAWGRFVYFQDPDGNAYALQELPARG